MTPPRMPGPEAGERFGAYLERLYVLPQRLDLLRVAVERFELGPAVDAIPTADAQRELRRFTLPGRDGC